MHLSTRQSARVVRARVKPACLHVYARAGGAGPRRHGEEALAQALFWECGVEERRRREDALRRARAVRERLRERLQKVVVVVAVGVEPAAWRRRWRWANTAPVEVLATSGALKRGPRSRAPE